MWCRVCCHRLLEEFLLKKKGKNKEQHEMNGSNSLQIQMQDNSNHIRASLTTGSSLARKGQMTKNLLTSQTGVPIHHLHP